MVKFNEVKLSYTCFAFPPDGVHIDKVYNIIKKENRLYFTDGIVEIEGEEKYIKMLFTPNGVEWKDVDFGNNKLFSKDN
jgi:hypothetical protein